MSRVWISLTRHEGPLLWTQWPAHEQRSVQGILRRQQGGGLESHSDSLP